MSADVATTEELDELRREVDDQIADELDGLDREIRNDITAMFIVLLLSFNWRKEPA